MKSIAAFDLDGTLVKKNSCLAFCFFLCEKGFLSYLDLAHVSQLYLRHCYLGLSLLDLHNLAFQRLFLGRSLDTLRPFVEMFLEQKLDGLWYHPALIRLRHLQKMGFESMILSNSPLFLVKPIAEKMGIDRVFATEYGSDALGKLSGVSSLMDGQKKADTLAQLSGRKIVAFSDSHLDLEFLRAAHVAVAVNPKYRLKKIALKQGWEVL